jgi:LuxR family transcriptional regulator, maltose regulon positive regulatory protein
MSEQNVPSHAIPVKPGVSLSPVVRRQRLIERLHELIHRRLTMVVAPAGYGKTTLLGDFAKDCAASDLPVAVCWYTAAPWDADPTLALNGIVTAIRERCQSFGERTLRLLGEARAGTSPAQLQQVIDSAVGVLVREAHEHVLDYTLLVIDDYQYLDDMPLTRRALELLLERLPEHMHVVLLSRIIPALDTSRQVLADDVGALGPRDLAFTADEIELFLRQRYAAEPEPPLVEELRQRTEGWIAGLVLAMPSPLDGALGVTAEALRSTLAAAWSGGERLNEFLSRHLFDRQMPEDQDLLLAASLPDTCDPRELDLVLERHDSQAALGRLERSGLPLTRIRGSANHYRLHGLLQQFLRSHSKQRNVSHHARLAQRWGAIAEDKGDYPAAIGRYLEANLYDRAARAIERIGEQWIESGRQGLVEKWLSQVPPQFLQKRPRLALCAGRLALAEGHHALAIERARLAGFAAQRRRDTAAAARALLLEATASVASGRPEDGLKLCLNALEQRSVRRSKPLRAEAYRYLSLAELVRGLPQPAVEHMEQALTLFEQQGESWHVATILNNLGVAYEQLGQAQEARWCHSRALALRRELGDLTGISSSLGNLGLLHFYQGAYEEAESHFREALSLAEQVGNANRRAALQVNVGDLRRAQQQPLAALECYRAANEAAQAAFDPRWRAHALVGEAAAHLMARSTDAADTAARQALECAERDGLREVAGYARAILAAVALSAGRRREASALLESARQTVRETSSVPLQVQVYLWSGKAAYDQKRWGEALASVQLAAEAAAALGGPALLTLAGKDLSALLKMAATRGVAPELLARALDSLDRNAASAVRGRVTADTVIPVLPKVTLQLLGTFSGTVAGVPVEGAVPPRSRVRELLAYLAVHEAGRRREEIGADLWPEAEPGQDVTLTYTTMHRLRQALFPELVVGESPTPGGYRINPSVALEVDVRRFEHLLREAEKPGINRTRRRDLLAEAVVLYSGPFFPECYSDWTTLIRLRLERRYVMALAALVDADWEANRYRECLMWCERLLECEQDEEMIHCRILECYDQLDEPLAGVIHYRRLARQLRQFEQPPRGRLAALYQRLENRLRTAS